MNTTMKIALSAFAAVAIATLPNVVAADQPKVACNDLIYHKVEEIRCASVDLTDEIKTHLRGAKGFRKMLGTNLLIRTKSAAIQRRVRRNGCYRRLEADVARINELTCVLQEQFDDVLACSTPSRPVCGDVRLIQERINCMRYLAACVRAEACRRLGLPVPVAIQRIQLEPELAPYQVAPGAQPIVQPQLAPEVVPILPQNSYKSVLEGGSDPIILEGSAPVIAPPIK